MLYICTEFIMHKKLLVHTTKKIVPQMQVKFLNMLMTAPDKGLNVFNDLNLDLSCNFLERERERERKRERERERKNTRAR